MDSWSSLVDDRDVAFLIPRHSRHTCHLAVPFPFADMDLGRLVVCVDAVCDVDVGRHTLGAVQRSDRRMRAACILGVGPL